MSYNTGNLIECQTLQVALEEFWQAEGTAGVDEMMPLEEVIMAAANQRNITQLILPSQGKKRAVEVVYQPRLTESVAEANVNNPLCVSTNKNGNLSKTYEFTGENIGYSENIEPADLEGVCTTNSTYIMSRITAIADMLERAVATQHAQEFALLAGTWGDGIFTTGNAAGNVNSSEEYVWTTRYADGKPNPESAWDLKFARSKIGMDGNIVGIGGSTAYKYFGALDIGCCADSGMNLELAMSRNGLGYAYDKRLTTALASENKFMLYKYGSILPLFHVVNPWKDGIAPGMIGANYTHTSIFSPRFGMPMDLTLSDNCGSITIAVAVNTQLITVPSDQFFTGDPYFGKTGVAKVLITNP